MQRVPVELHEHPLSHRDSLGRKGSKETAAHSLPHTAYFTDPSGHGFERGEIPSVFSERERKRKEMQRPIVRREGFALALTAFAVATCCIALLSSSSQSESELVQVHQVFVLPPSAGDRRRSDHHRSVIFCAHLLVSVSSSPMLSPHLGRVMLLPRQY